MRKIIYLLALAFILTETCLILIIGGSTGNQHWKIYNKALARLASKTRNNTYRFFCIY